MKKMMILMAVALCASCINAASVIWNVNAFTGPNGESSNTGAAHDNLYTATLSVFTDSGLSNAVTGLGGDGESYSSSFTKKGKTGGATLDVITGSTSGTTYWAVLEIVTQDGLYQYTSDAQTFTYTTGDLADPSLSFSGPTSKTMWVAAGGGDVPEPTSGLLLLVGGAMLALRRKQK